MKIENWEGNERGSKRIASRIETFHLIDLSILYISNYVSNKKSPREIFQIVQTRN